MIDIAHIKYNHLLFDASLNTLVLEQMELESDLLFGCMESNIILEAEAEKVNSVGSKMGAIVNNTINFFTKILTTFKTKIKEFLDFNKKWFDENIEKFAKLNYDGLEIEAIPFWNIKTNDIIRVLDSFAVLINKVPTGKNLETMSTREEIEKLPAINKYKSNDGDLSTGLQKYFKVGNTELKPVKLSGNTLKGYCTGEFKAYITEYHNNMLGIIDARVTKLKGMMKQVQIAMSKPRPLGEVFCILENTTYNNTELRFSSNCALLEADGDNKQEEKKEDKVKTTAVIVTDENNDGNKYNNSSSGELSYIKNIIQINQLAVGTAMNALEEKYKVYINILRQVLKARKPQ